MAAFAGIMAVFVTTVVASQYWVVAIDAPAHEIASDTSPAIEDLTLARAQLRRLQAYVTAYAFADPVRRKEIAPGLSAARRDLDKAIDAYLDLPSSDSAHSVWERVRQDLRTVNADANRVEFLVQSGGARQAREDVLMRFVGEVDAASAGLLRAIQVEAESAHAAASRIETLRDRAIESAILFGVLGSLFAVVAIVMGLRIVRSHAELLEEHNRLLRHRASELEIFAARVAHDIVSPLSAVGLALGSVARRHPDDERSMGTIGRARSSLERVERIVRDLLEFARAGVRPERAARTPVRSVVDEVVAEIVPEAETGGIEIAVESRPGDDLCAACAPGILASIVSNLARNAVKHMGEAPERRVLLRVLDGGEVVRIEVEDTGPGLPSGAEEWVFDPYARGNDNTPGLGLGLATVRRLAEAHGGRVGMRSAPGAGARFWVELPKASPPPPPPPHVLHPPARSA